jgi:hypothetical protein
MFRAYQNFFFPAKKYKKNTSAYYLAVLKYFAISATSAKP